MMKWPKWLMSSSSTRLRTTGIRTKSLVSPLVALEETQIKTWVDLIWWGSRASQLRTGRTPTRDQKYQALDSLAVELKDSRCIRCLYLIWVALDSKEKMAKTNSLEGSPRNEMVSADWTLERQWRFSKKPSRRQRWHWIMRNRNHQRSMI